MESFTFEEGDNHGSYLSWRESSKEPISFATGLRCREQVRDDGLEDARRAERERGESVQPVTNLEISTSGSDSKTPSHPRGG